jgi:phosphate transport system permease protein
VVELLAAVPSVIYGLWAFFILVPLMRTTIEPAIQSVVYWHIGWVAPFFWLEPLFSGTPAGLDKFTAGVVLAIMIIPTVSAICREAFLQVPQSQREAALSLGATQWETTRVAVIGYSRSGIFGASILGLGRALGETMAVTMVIGNSPIISASLFVSGASIASQIAGAFPEAATGSLQQSALLALALVLLVISLAINVLARLLIGRSLRTEGSRE